MIPASPQVLDPAGTASRGKPRREILARFISLYAWISGLSSEGASESRWRDLDSNDVDADLTLIQVNDKDFVTMEQEARRRHRPESTQAQEFRAGLVAS